MKVNQLHLIYFSPTGTTRKVIMSVAHNIDLKSVSYDLTTTYRTKEPNFKFKEQDFVLIGIPVYSGRVPKIVLEYLSHLSGSNTPTALIATYGNRAYEDALLELKTVVEEKGLKVIGAAAFPVEHSIVKVVAKGRPDKEDMRKINDYGIQLNRKIKAIEDLSTLSLTVDGNPEYRPYKTIPLVPHGSSACTGCNTCVKLCPASAIDAKTPRKTTRKKCISCMRCVYGCPQKVRSVNKLFYKKAKGMLIRTSSYRKEPDIFI